MLVTLKEALDDARKKRYAVGHFIIVNLEMAKGVIQAAEENKSPVIIGPTEVFLEKASLKELSDLLLPMAKNAKVPVVLHYDHGFTAKKVLEALSYGYSSVMFDCSMKSFDENKMEVAKMAEIAKLFGASIEAEIGHVGSNGVGGEGQGENDSSVYTEPFSAKLFVDYTGVDALAVAIGTAHGAYKNKPKLDYERLKKIADTVNKPIVLHGGSGLSDDEFRQCIANGAAKINIFTDINCAAAKAAYDFYFEKCGHTDIMHHVVEAVKKATAEKINLFGSEGKA